MLQIVINSLSAERFSISKYHKINKIRYEKFDTSFLLYKSIVKYNVFFRILHLLLDIIIRIITKSPVIANLANNFLFPIYSSKEAELINYLHIFKHVVLITYIRGPIRATLREAEGRWQTIAQVRIIGPSSSADCFKREQLDQL